MAHRLAERSPPLAAIARRGTSHSLKLVITSWRKRGNRDRRASRARQPRPNPREPPRLPKRKRAALGRPSSGCAVRCLRWPAGVRSRALWPARPAHGRPSGRAPCRFSHVLSWFSSHTSSALSAASFTMRSRTFFSQVTKSCLSTNACRFSYQCVSFSLSPQG